MNELLADLYKLEQRCINFIANTHQALFDNRHIAANWYPILLLSGLFLYLIVMPIMLTDTDMWYHLNGGRQTWLNGEVHSSTFFSFITPERSWVNYYWGFQLLAYTIFSFFDYYGLIVFKAILVTGTAYVLSKIIFDKVNASHIRAAHLIVFSLIVYVISLRATGVRPHLVSYFFIVTFIYILFHKNKFIPFLPLLTIVWVNLHGTEWPIGALICGSYVLQQIIEYKKTNQRDSLKFIPWVLACIPAMMLNPFGFNILLAPFSVASEAYMFINELKPTTIGFFGLISFDNYISGSGAIALLFLLFFFAVMGLWHKGHLKFYQFLLGLGGLILLFRGQRFIWEWCLLSIPLFKASADYLFLGEIKKNRIIALFLVLLAAFSPFYYWTSMAANFNRYPFDDIGLPVATTQFVKQNNIKGKYFLLPSLAGYVEWELYPDVLIHGDMEFPPFNEMDFYEARKAMTSQQGFDYFVNKYSPDLIGVIKSASLFEQWVKKEGVYVPVFFDDKIVLYINKNTYPDIVERYQIKHLDPFNLLSGITQDDLQPQIDELFRVVKFYEDTPDTLIALSSFLTEAKRTQEAEPYIKKILDKYGNSASSYFLAGVYYHNLKQYKRAVEMYETALSFGGSVNYQRTIRKNLGTSFYLLEDYESAYQQYKKSVNPYVQKLSMAYYYQYAYASFVVDDVDNAERLCRMMLIINDGSNDELVQNAKELLKVIEEGNFARSFWK